MIDQQLPPSPRVTLEDLIRLKRAERPPAEFWMDFERNLRAKQLAAIVEKRPWWRSGHSFPFSRWSVPLGAAAAVAFTFFAIGPSYRQSEEAVSNASTIESVRVAHEVPAPRLPVEENLAGTFTVPSQSASTVSYVSVAPVVPEPQNVAPVATVETRDTLARTQLASVTEQIAGIGLDAETDTQTEAVPRFASLVQNDFTSELGAFFKHAVANLDSNRAERTPSIEPLSQVPTPRDARRARLLAFTSSVDTHSPQYSDSSNVIRSRDRIANRLSEDALYDSIRRLDIKNGGVSIQF